MTTATANDRHGNQRDIPPHQHKGRTTTLSNHRPPATIATILTAILATLAATLTFATGAIAATQYAPNGHFGSEGAGDGQFEVAGSVAVEQSSGDVYVADVRGGRIEKFDANGGYLSQFSGAETPAGSFTLVEKGTAIAVDNSGVLPGNVYVADPGHGVVDVFDSFGHYLRQLDGSNTPEGSIGEPTGVAVDGSGDVYVSNQSNSHIDEFDSTGAFISEFEAPGYGSADGIAVNAAGTTVYVLRNLEIESWNAAAPGPGTQPGSGQTLIDPGRAVSAAVDPVGGDVFALREADEVVERTSSGAFVRQFGTYVLQEWLDGIAVTANAATVYVAEQRDNQVDVFKAVTVPDLTTDAASSVTSTGAALSGTVNPDGIPVTSCMFEYGKTESYGQSVACSPQPGAGSSPVEVAASVTGLTPGTTYHYRLRSGNAEAANTSADQTFTTLGPSLIAEVAVGVTRTSAFLAAQLRPNGHDTTYHFEYGTSASYGTSVPVPDGDLGAGEGLAVAFQHLSGLQPGVTYHFRIVAVNSQGTIEGPDETFTTVPVAKIGHSYASAVTATDALLQTSIDPIGLDTTYRFEYGPSAAYGSSVPLPDADVGAGEQAVALNQAVSGLQPDTTYHFRVLASNSSGTLASPDETFKTFPASSGAPEGCPNAVERTGPSVGLPDCRGYELLSPVEQASDLVAAASSGDGDHAWLASTLPLTGDQLTGHSTVFTAVRGAAGWQLQTLTDPNADERYEYVFRGYSEDGSRAIVEKTRHKAGSTVGTLTYEAVSVNGDRTTLATVPYPETEITGDSYVGQSGDATRIFIEDEHPLLSADTHTEGAELYEGHDGGTELLGVDESGHAFACGALLAGYRNSPGRGFEQGGLSSDGRTVFFEAPDPRQGCREPVDLYVRRDGHSIDISRPAGASPDLGASYIGNSRDGAVVFFATASQLVAQDTDERVDIYRYDVASATLQLITGGAGVKGLDAALSPDGSHVYFVSQNPIAGHGTLGMDNLFVWSAGTTSYIASGPSKTIALGQSEANGSSTSDGSPITPDGKVLLFFSRASLTGYDNTDALTGEPDDELFRYSAGDGLACVSCNPSGAPPATTAEHNVVLQTGTVFWSIITSRYMSDDGRMVFFTSESGLLPQDTNGGADVYEWHDGKLSLITPGEAGEGIAELVGVSASGGDVLFTSQASLVPGLDQGNLKLYDARVGGGFAPPADAAQCAGEACRGAASPAPVFDSPASGLLSGPGDAPSPSRAIVKKAKKKTKAKARVKRRTKKTKSGKKVKRGHKARGSAHVRKSTGRGR